MRNNFNMPIFSFCFCFVYLEKKGKLYLSISHELSNYKMILMMIQKNKSQTKLENWSPMVVTILICVIILMVKNDDKVI